MHKKVVLFPYELNEYEIWAMEYEVELEGVTNVSIDKRK